MTVARHPMPADIAGLSLEEIEQKYVARFRDRKPDWAAFEDAKIEGFKRAQHRFIGAGGSGKHGEASVIPPRAFTLSNMYVEPGQGKRLVDLKRAVERCRAGQLSTQIPATLKESRLLAPERVE